MNSLEREQMLERYHSANVWLTRIYDPTRSDDHRVGLWNFLMNTADNKLKHILTTTRLCDEQCVEFWDKYGRN